MVQNKTDNKRDGAARYAAATGAGIMASLGAERLAALRSDQKADANEAPGHVELRLQRAERDIRWVRNPGLVGWFVVLLGHGYSFGLNAVWIIYAAGIAYGIWAHRRADRIESIRRTAVITTLGDPVLAFFICLVTGGLDSVFFPFFYFTQISVAMRFGVVESLCVALFNASLCTLMFYTQPWYTGAAQTATYLELGTTWFLLGFAGLLGAIMAGWAREGAELVREHADVMRRSSERLRELLHRLTHVQEEERRNISGELHDRMSGHLFELRQGLEQCLRDDVGEAEVQSRLQSLSETVRACTQDVRSIMNELRPTVLDELGFFEAASEYLTRQSEHTPYRLSLHIDPALRDWRSRQDAMLFRLLQEALLNINKHAQATQVDVTLEPDDSDVVLRIRDNGCGFDPASIPIGHYGLLTMRERAEAAGGMLTVSSGEEQTGTIIEVRLPRGDSP